MGWHKQGEIHVETGIRSRRQFMRRLMRVVLGAAMGSTVICASAEPSSKGYDYYLTGNPGDTVLAQGPRSPSTVLMGGGPDVDAAFQWMIRKAGGGDFVVIRVRGTDGYNQYVFDMGGLDSVETLVITKREAASDPFVLDRVNKAEALFIAGGDQSDYINLWKGTPLEAALNGLISRNVPIGGTSAGLAVLGQFDFAALNGTVYSPEALADPYNRRMTLDQGFLTAPGLNGVIADAHLVYRDRMGRLLTFVARIIQDKWVSTESARGIGLDVETALVIDNGIATRLGVGSVYFLRPSIAPAVCRSGQPLTFRNVMVDRLSGPGSFHLNTWSSPGNGATRYDLSAETGVLISSQPGGGIY
ncbi:MAG TPA: cyanophycinase [Nitrosospira sp.]